MSDREKLIKHFEHLLNAAKSDDQDFVDLTIDAGEEILALLKEQEAIVPLTIDNAVSEIMDNHYKRLKEQGTKWIHREDLDFKDKLGCNHFHGMCGNCGFIHDFIDEHTGQYKYCPQCGRMVQWE